MDQPLEVTNIKTEVIDSTSSDQKEIPTEMQLNLVKQENDCIVPTEIYIKTELQEDQREVPMIEDNSYGMHSYDNVKFTTIKVEPEDPEEDVMQDPLNVGDEITDEKHSPIYLNHELRIITELTEGKQDAHLLETDMDNTYSSRPNQSQNQLFVRNEFRQKKTYVCNVCNWTFKLKGNLDNHMRIHTGERPFICDICGKSFSVKTNLDTHMLLHSGEKPHACDICKKVFRHKNTLKDHKLTHTDVKSFFCNECNQSFRRKQGLVRHKLIHTGDKPFVCDICNKAFGRKSFLTEHIRTHTGEKPYCCDICNKSFTQKSTLNGHKQKHRN